MATPVDDIRATYDAFHSINEETIMALENLTFWPEPYSQKAFRLVSKYPRLSSTQYDAFFKSKVKTQKSF
jgi:hypothetical protein